MRTLPCAAVIEELSKSSCFLLSSLTKLNISVDDRVHVCINPKDELAPEVMKNLVYQDEGRGAFQPLKKIYGKIGAPEMIDIACKIPIKGGNILDVVYDATDLELWVSYAEKQDEAYKRPFVHFKLKDYLK